MKNIHLIIVLLVLVILSVIGLNLKLKKESFAVGNTIKCYDMIMDGNNTALKNRLDFIEKSGETGSNMANLLKLMDVNTYSQYDGNGNVTSFPGNPCIFPKTLHSTYNVNNKTCTDMGFTGSNQIGDCLYEIITESNLTSFIQHGHNLYTSKTSAGQAATQSAMQEINAANTARDTAITSNMEVTAQDAVATSQYNAAVAELSSLTTTQNSLQGTYNAATVQGATAQASVTASSNNVINMIGVETSLAGNGLSSSSSQLAEWYPQSPLPSGNPIMSAKNNTFTFSCTNQYGDFNGSWMYDYTVSTSLTMDQYNSSTGYFNGNKSVASTKGHYHAIYSATPFVCSGYKGSLANSTKGPKHIIVLVTNDDVVFYNLDTYTISSTGEYSDAFDAGIPGVKRTFANTNAYRKYYVIFNQSLNTGDFTWRDWRWLL